MALLLMNTLLLCLEHKFRVVVQLAVLWVVSMPHRSPMTSNSLITLLRLLTQQWCKAFCIFFYRVQSVLWVQRCWNNTKGCKDRIALTPFHHSVSNRWLLRVYLDTYLFYLFYTCIYPKSFHHFNNMYHRTRPYYCPVKKNSFLIY